MHKLVFEEDVLPDGTELGYFVRGKVRVRVYFIMNFFYSNFISFLSCDLMCCRKCLLVIKGDSEYFVYAAIQRYPFFCFYFLPDEIVV